jgi:aryl-alcohol dehydrogenase-like predicted oxidoreductase
MKYRLLGRSGLRVSEVCLGTMTFGQEWGWGSTKEESRKVFDTYADRGGNFLDTANRYTEGTSEQLVGEFIKGSRERFVVATKYSLYTTKGDPNASGNHRKNMVQAVEASLKRLGTDYIDLYYLHAWDFFTPVDEVMRAFDDLVRAGKVVYVGISDTPAWIVSQANTMAELRGWTPFIGLQIEYSLIERTAERDLIPMANAFGMAVLPWGPLAGGLLSGKYTSTNGAHTATEAVRLKEGSLRLTGHNLAIADEVVRVAEALGHTPSQVALAWLMQRAGTIIPIVGARRAEQLAETLQATEITLPEEARRRLDTVSAIDLGFPHEWLTRGYVRDLIYGDTYALIKNRQRTTVST